MNHETYTTINLGIFAHVDAGKTTITENLLFQSGVIKERGRVDKGDTQTDSMIQERERGISIEAAPVSFPIGPVKVNLIDTPGHVDFVAEVERSISILDAAILVLSAREGVQAHTHLLFNTLKKLGVPIILFINKIDRAGCDIEQVLEDIQNELTHNFLPVQTYKYSGSREAEISELLSSELQDSLDFLADRDDRLFRKVINDKPINNKDLLETLVSLSRSGKIYPLLFGSGLLGLGIKQLLEAIPLFFPSTSIEKENPEPVSWQVFKIKRTKENTKQTFIRVFKGSVKLWDIYDTQKVTKIQIFKEGRKVEVSSLPKGEIGIVQGLKDYKVNDVYGQGNPRKRLSMGSPTLRYAVESELPSQKMKLIKAIGLLAECDPYLEYEIDDNQGRLYLNLFGEIQMEIIKDQLKRDHNLEINFLKPEIICREAPVKSGESRINMGDKNNPFTAELGIRVDANISGAGNAIRSEIPEGDMPQGLLKGAFEGITHALRQGLMGWEITDTVITVIHNYFVCTTTPADYRNLAPMVLFEALEKAGTELLWPILRFEIHINEKFYGPVMEDLIKMGARKIDITERNRIYQMVGLVPAEYFQEYSKKFSGYGGGHCSLHTTFHSFEKAPDPFRKIRKKIYPDPLNKYQYIMSLRGRV